MLLCLGSLDGLVGLSIMLRKVIVVLKGVPHSMEVGFFAIGGGV